MTVSGFDLGTALGLARYREAVDALRGDPSFRVVYHSDLRGLQVERRDSVLFHSGNALRYLAEHLEKDEIDER